MHECMSKNVIDSFNHSFCSLCWHVCSCCHHSLCLHLIALVYVPCWIVSISVVGACSKYVLVTTHEHTRFLTWVAFANSTSLVCLFYGEAFVWRNRTWWSLISHLKVGCSVVNHVVSVCQIHLLVKSRAHANIFLLEYWFVSNLYLKVLLFNFGFELFTQVRRPLLWNVMEIGLV